MGSPGGFNLEMSVANCQVKKKGILSNSRVQSGDKNDQKSAIESKNFMSESGFEAISL